MADKDAGKWKSHLAASGMPLEFEVAKLLVSRDFSVTADYPYHRIDAGQFKEFSVDLEAHFLGGYLEHIGSGTLLRLLVECKARHRGVQWLFLPDPNQYDFSPLSWGSALRAVDAFSTWFLHERPYDIDGLLPAAYKGVEIEAGSGKAHDSEIRHGLLQLQYGLPSVLYDSLRAGGLGHPVDNTPFFYTAILVTDAPLLLAPRTFSRTALEHAASPRQLGREVPYLLMYVETGPEFEAHSARHFRDAVDLLELEPLKVAETYRERAGVLAMDLPSRVVKRLARGSEYVAMQKQFNHFIVCNSSHVGDLLTRIKRSFTRCSKSVSGERPQKVPPPVGTDGAPAAG